MFDDPAGAPAALLAYVLSDPWILVGFAGQFLFMMRFLVQWVHSERQKRSIIPPAFWFFSIGGGIVLLSYAISRLDPVFIAGQGLGLVIYARNLYLIYGVKHPVANGDELDQAKRLIDDLEVRIHAAKDFAGAKADLAGPIAELQSLMARATR